jgi:Lrp/AsnC family leucine-responsive transcriptional regulator
MRKELPALDPIDRKILRRLQENNRISNQDLAREVGLSPPACLARCRRLREIGVVKADVSVLDPATVGFPVSVLVRIALERPREDLLQAFERKVRDLPQVLQCWTVAGDVDFVLLVVAESIEEYQRFARTALASEHNIKSYTSDVVLSTAKSTCALPISGTAVG